MSYSLSGVGLLASIQCAEYRVNIYSAGSYPEIEVHIPREKYMEVGLLAEDVVQRSYHCFHRTTHARFDAKKDELVLDIRFQSFADYVANWDSNWMEPKEGETVWDVTSLGRYALEFIHSLERRIRTLEAKNAPELPYISKEEFYDIIKG